MFSGFTFNNLFKERPKNYCNKFEYFLNNKDFSCIFITNIEKNSSILTHDKRLNGQFNSFTDKQLLPTSCHCGG